MDSNLMKAVVLYRNLPIKNPDSLVDVIIHKPKADGKDLLIKVKAISVNPVDVKIRSSKGNIENNPEILGWDVAGVVEQVGENVTLFQEGDEVFYAGSISRPGCYSEFHLVDERIVAKKPKTLNFSEAAALPLTSITSWEALFERLDIPKHKKENENKNILIVGAAGGVGSIATQLATYFGLTVIGTASKPESEKWVLGNGANYVINHYKSFLPQLEKLGMQTIDYILCLNCLEMHWVNMATAITPQGKICSIVHSDNPINLTLLKNKSITFAWEYMFTRSLFQTKDMIQQHYILEDIAKLIDQNKIKTTKNVTLNGINASNLRKAHKIIENGRTIGKVVIVI